MRKVFIMLLSFLLTIMILPSCKKFDPLNNTSWYAVKAKGDTFLEDVYISITFYNGGFEGYDGCNSYSAKYLTDKPDAVNMTLGKMSITSKGCVESEKTTAQKKLYFQAIWKAAFFNISGNILTFYDSERNEILVLNRRQVHLMDPADLIGTKWVLESINEITIPDGLSITLAFDSNNEAGGRAGNYNYWLMDYHARGDIIRWGIRSARDGEPLPSHERYVMEYLDAIGAGTHQYNQQENSLEIYTQKGDTLVYRMPDDV